MVFLLSNAQQWLNVQIYFTLKTSTILLTLALVAVALSGLVRYRVTTRYARLPKELDTEEEQESKVLSDVWNEFSDFASDDVFPRQLGAMSHLDDFLKAIKVFGYLETEVYNELTKSTQTIRVNAGERVNLRELNGFTLVLSGSMRVYCASDCADSDLDLLNEITRPAPISSLSSILSLFLDNLAASNGEKTAFEQVNENICAIANEPSTIVVIPASAFRDLKWKFPLATANIVQIIFFRWSQITFRTCQRYLNLTQQFYGTERLLNDSQRNVKRLTLPTETRHVVIRQIKAQLAQADYDQKILQLSTSRVPSLSKPIVSEPSSAVPVSNKSKESPNQRREEIRPDTKLHDTKLHDTKLHDTKLHDHNFALPQRHELAFEDALHKERRLSEINVEKSVDQAAALALREAKEQSLFSARKEIVKTIFSIIGLEIPSLSLSDYNHVLKERYLNRISPLDSVYRSSPDASKQAHLLKPVSATDFWELTSDRLELFWYRQGQYVSKYNERSPGLVYVLDGTLEVRNHPSVIKSDLGKDQHLYDVHTGDITGFLETISSNMSFVDLVAKEDTCVAVIPKSCFELLVEQNPLLYISVAKTLTNNLSLPMVKLDFALEWVSLKSGDRLLQQGTPANSIYFVLNGRLRAYKNHKNVSEFGFGTSFGELETMSGGTYAATAIAVRDTELSRFPRSLIELLARQYPSITFEMSKMVVQAMQAQNSLQVDQAQLRDIKTVAVLPTHLGLPTDDFAAKLSTAFQMNAKSVKVLTNTVILQYLGKYAFHKMGTLKLKAYLSELEERYDVILYVGDGNPSSSWTRMCISEAYLRLIVVDGLMVPFYSEVEKLVVKSPNRSLAHLVFLHRERQVKHGSTAKWLKHRPWISAHHHVQMELNELDVGQQHHNVSSLLSRDSSASHPRSRVQQKFAQIKNRVQDEIRLLNSTNFLRRPRKKTGAGTAGLQYKNDFLRLARILSGEAVGLVLGGGGARGLSHVGVLQALEEAGVPIDMVGGTSIGSLIGGLYAQDYDLMPLLRKAKQFSSRVSEFWRLVADITYPMTAWTTGHEFNRAVWKALGDSRIEDFWLPYFANTTNLSYSRMDVHHRGYAWRYIRASMSLAGLLPPIEEKGMMLLDGGYVDNLPVTEMKKMGARYIIAVDVGAVDDPTPLQYGDTLSGMWALVNKYNPFSSRPNPPNIAEIQQRLTYVSSVKALEEAKSDKDVIYLRPPIDNYATLDFGKFDEIREVGFVYGNQTIPQQIVENKLPTFRGGGAGKERRFHYRRYSF